MQDSQDAVNQGQTQRDQRINRSHGDTVQKLFQKELHKRIKLLRKYDQGQA
jgi:hypothetical protein